MWMWNLTPQRSHRVHERTNCVVFKQFEAQNNVCKWTRVFGMRRQYRRHYTAKLHTGIDCVYCCWRIRHCRSYETISCEASALVSVVGVSSSKYNIYLFIIFAFCPDFFAILQSFRHQNAIFYYTKERKKKKNCAENVLGIFRFRPRPNAFG